MYKFVHNKFIYQYESMKIILNLSKTESKQLKNLQFRAITVYCEMKMEARAAAFPQIQTVLNGVNVPDVQLDDIQAILNMRDAWSYLLNTFDEPVTPDFLCKLNEFIAEMRHKG